MNINERHPITLEQIRLMNVQGRSITPDNQNIQIYNLQIQDDCLTAILKMPICQNQKVYKCVTPKLHIKDVGFQLRIHLIMEDLGQNRSVFGVLAGPSYEYIFSVKTESTLNADEVFCEFYSKALGIRKKIPTSTEGFLIIHESRTTDLNFDVKFKLIEHESNPVGMFRPLYDDTELTDFELSVADGSLKVHKAVLAATSPVLRSMLCGGGVWKEAVNGSLHMHDTSLATLEDFKRYLYLRKIPDNGSCGQLLLLAHFYQIPLLEELCIKQIVKSANAGNFLELCKFASVHEMTKLHLALLKHMESGAIKISEIPNSDIM